LPWGRRLPGVLVPTAKHKAHAKRGFTAALFTAMLYTLYGDSSELVTLRARSDGLFHFYIGTVAVLFTSPNTVTGATFQAFGSVFSS